MTSLPHSGSKPPLLLEYRPVAPGSYALADLQSANAEPDWNDPVEVQAFALMRDGRTDEALSLLQGELGRARTRMTGEGLAPESGLSGSSGVSTAASQLADVRPGPSERGFGALVARRASFGPTGASPVQNPSRWAPLPARGPAMWAIGLASVTLAVLAGTLWPTTDLGATSALGTLALEAPPATSQTAAAKSAATRPETTTPTTTASIGLQARPDAIAPLKGSEAATASADPAISVSPLASGAKATDRDGWGTPAAGAIGLATLQEPSDAAVVSVPFTPRPRPQTPTGFDDTPLGDVASAEAEPKATPQGKARDGNTTATPRARNRAAAQAYAQKRRAPAERAAGRQVPLIGDGAGYAGANDRYDRDGPVILLGGRGLP